MRHESRGFLRDTIRTAGTLITGLALIVLSHLTVAAAFPWIWIDLQSVVVPHHMVGDNPRIEVWRTIRSDFDGRWSVVVRRAETHEYVCITPGPDIDPKVTLPYRRAANALQPYRPDLASWMRDDGALHDCTSRGFQDGAFYLETCQTVRIAGLWPVSRCVPSNVFQRR